MVNKAILQPRNNFQYIEDIALGEAHQAVEGMIKDALKLGSSDKRKIGGDYLSIELSYQSGRKPLIRRPFEKDVRRESLTNERGYNQCLLNVSK